MADDQGRDPTASPLVFRGRLELTDVLNIRRYEDQLLLGRRLRWLGIVCFTVLAAICLGSVVKNGAQTATIGILVLWVYLLFVLPFERRRSVQQHYRKHEAEYLETRVSLAADRVAIENSACRSDFEWKLVGFVADTPEGLMVCNQARQVLFWLPSRLFEGTHLRDQVLDLVARHGVPIRRLH